MSLVVEDLGEPVPPPSSSACTTTLADAIHRTRGELLTRRREERNRLTNDITAGAGSMDFDFPLGGIAPNARLAIDLEVFHVYEITGTGAVVEPAEQGSVAAAHAAGAVVWVNNRQSDFDIMNAVNDTLRTLSTPDDGGMFRVATAELTYNPSIDGYDLDGVTALQDIIDVWWPVPSTTKEWRKLHWKQYRLQRNADLSVFPSGYALFLDRSLGAQQNDTFRFTYKTSYNYLADYTDNVETVTGLHCEAHDLLWIGAAIRLADGREIERNQTMSQGEPRRAGEVPAGAVNNAVAGLQRRWQTRRPAEASRLARMYPTLYR